MKILYYAWKEFTYEDAVSALKALGHEIYVDNSTYAAFDFDERFIASVKKRASDSKADIIFSFNYFPDLSRCAADLGIPYVSWCYDSPLLTLESKTLSDPNNRVFLFDRALTEHYKSTGANVFHLPLACNVSRLENAVRNVSGYEHDITFLGNMYSDENDFYSRIKYLPDYLKGYNDCAMETQMKIFGTDMISELITDDICDKMAEYAQFDMGEHYNDSSRNTCLRFMIQKQTTVRERLRLLSVISEYYNVDHYAKDRCKEIKANYMGYADYMTQMPKIFASSGINLNITLRSIITGIPLRVIDILGAGGFCITNYQQEIAEYFENDRSIVWYESYEELFEKLGYYLKNDEKRLEIAKRGHELIADCFTYEKRFEEIFKRI